MKNLFSVFAIVCIVCFVRSEEASSGNYTHHHAKGLTERVPILNNVSGLSKFWDHSGHPRMEPEKPLFNDSWVHPDFISQGARYEDPDGGDLIDKTLTTVYPEYNGDIDEYLANYYAFWDARDLYRKDWNSWQARKASFIDNHRDWRRKVRRQPILRHVSRYHTGSSKQWADDVMDDPTLVDNAVDNNRINHENNHPRENSQNRPHTHVSSDDHSDDGTLHGPGARNHDHDPPYGTQHGMNEMWSVKTLGMGSSVSSNNLTMLWADLMNR